MRFCSVAEYANFCGCCNAFQCRVYVILLLLIGAMRCLFFFFVCVVHFFSQEDTLHFFDQLLCGGHTKMRLISQFQQRKKSTHDKKSHTCTRRYKRTPIIWRIILCKLVSRRLGGFDLARANQNLCSSIKVRWRNGGTKATAKN